MTSAFSSCAEAPTDAAVASRTAIVAMRRVPFGMASPLLRPSAIAGPFLQSFTWARVSKARSPAIP